MEIRNQGLKWTLFAFLTVSYVLGLDLMKPLYGSNSQESRFLGRSLMLVEIAFEVESCGCIENHMLQDDEG